MRQIQKQHWKVDDRISSLFVLTRLSMENLWAKTKLFLKRNNDDDLRQSLKPKMVTTRVKNGNVTVLFQKAVMP